MSEARTGDLIAGRYRLLEELGGGGMGIVFRARDTRDSRDVAVKILRRATPEASRRLLREARATEGIDPTRVARVYDVGETANGDPFLVMDYVEGKTLRALLREGPIPRLEAVRLLREIAATLDQAHRLGLVHRDVKPDNVIARPDGGVVLLDFGIAKHLHPSDDVAQITTQLTFEGAMIGTPAYLAPEQALGREVGPSTDQFALAVTAYELLTGKLPWTAAEVTRVLAQVLAEPPPSASTMNSTLPRPYDAVLVRALAKSPEARFSSVTSFIDALEAAERGEEMTVSPASTTFEGPSPPSAITKGTAQATPIESRGSGLRGPLLGATLLVLAGTGVLLARRPVAAPSSLAAQAPPQLVVTTEKPLACPIFAVEGMSEVATRIGAAASALACTRAKWYVGGSDAKIRVPAALLDAPVEPKVGLPAYYDGANVRAETIEAAKQRGLPVLDGIVTRIKDGWRVELTIRGDDGREVARSGAVEEPFLVRAVRAATGRLWGRSEPAALDPEVVKWTAFPDAEAGLAWVDLSQDANREGCATIHRRGGSLGLAYGFLDSLCSDSTPLSDAGVVHLDESSGSALVTTLYALPAPGLPDEDTKRVAEKAEDFARSEVSPFGRSALHLLAGQLFVGIKERERAYAAFIAAATADPLNSYAWYHLVYSAGETGSSEATTLVASTWFPQEAAFLKYASAKQSDALEQRLHDSQIAYLLEPTLTRTLALGAVLAEAGRLDEVRALSATTPADQSGPDQRAASYLLGCIDMHDALFERAIGRFEEGSPVGLEEVPILAAAAGRSDEIGTKWATEFLVTAQARAIDYVKRSAAPVALCMVAKDSLAARCFARVETLAEASYRRWGVGGDKFLAGAKRYAAGDFRGAINEWRPLVGTSNDRLLRLLPTAIFDRLGEHDLAARIDERKLHYRQLAGVSEATPREAHRAFDRGDRARAKELAQSVVHAWEVADTVIPAVADMKALLAKIGD